MESARVSFLVSFLLLGLASPAVSRSLGEFNEEKNFFFYPISGSTGTPPYSGSTPTYGGGSTPSTPSYGTGGGHSTPSTPSYGTGGGHSPYPTTPSYGSGHGSPTPTYGSTTPMYGSGSGTPSTPSYGHGSTTPTYGSGSGTPSTPSYGIGSGHATPTPSMPSIDPGHFITGTCDYWRSHLQQITAIVGYITTLGQTFGAACGVIIPPTTSLTDALSSLRPDAYGALIREGTAAFINSMSNSHFPFTSDQVRSAVISCLPSLGAAAAQADIFRQANQGHYHV